MSRLRCAVQGCRRPADTLIEGDNRLTGERLPDAYACGDPTHQWAVAIAMLPSGTQIPDAGFAARVQRELAAWNEASTRDE